MHINNRSSLIAIQEQIRSKLDSDDKSAGYGSELELSELDGESHMKSIIDRKHKESIET